MSAPKITDITEKADRMTFTISGINVAFVNGLRRAINSHIKAVVFKTSPYEENKATIKINTISSMNNEIVKHRLSGIPIHITDPNFPIQNYIIECAVENKTDTVLYVTTNDFKIKNTITGTYLGDVETRNIFPPAVGGGPLLFLELKPQLSDSVPGEAIDLTCEFSWEESGKSGMFKQECCCAYGNTVDKAAANAALPKIIDGWKKEQPDITKEKLDMLVQNWELLDGKRFSVENSFDFVLETIGVYSNRALLISGCNYLIDKMGELHGLIADSELRIEPSKITAPFSFDVFLEHGEDYTIGGILSHLMFTKYYMGTKDANFVGLKQFHPHDKFIVLRVGYHAAHEPATLSQQLMECIKDGIDIVEKMRGQFSGSATATAAAVTKPAVRKAAVKK